jgi:hypothetical protein
VPTLRRRRGDDPELNGIEVADLACFWNVRTWDQIPRDSQLNNNNNNIPQGTYDLYIYLVRPSRGGWLHRGPRLRGTVCQPGALAP